MTIENLHHLAAAKVALEEARERLLDYGNETHWYFINEIRELTLMVERINQHVAKEDRICRVSEQPAVTTIGKPVLPQTMNSMMTS